jgi:hypothetical protein
MQKVALSSADIKTFQTIIIENNFNSTNEELTFLEKIKTKVENTKLDNDRANPGRIKIGDSAKGYNKDGVLRKINELIVNIKLQLNQAPKNEQEKKLIETKVVEVTASKVIIPQNPKQEKKLSIEPEKVKKVIQSKFKSLFKLKNEEPAFRKSYSILSSYTSLINCSISIPNSVKNPNIPGYSFFDIPYNYIKSLRVESNTGDALNSKLTLTLEDPTGTTVTILMATLHLLAMTHKSNMPKINISFGWGGNERISQRISNKKNYYFKTVSDKSYIILKSEITYENLKQKLVLTCTQDLTSIDDVLIDKTPFSVFKTNFLGQVILQNRISIFANQFLKGQKKLIGIDKDVDNILYNESLTIDIKKNIFEIDKNLYGDDLSKGPKSKLPYLFSFGLQNNQLYNAILKQDSFELNQEIFENGGWDSIYTTTRFHPYTIFCLILNQFINTLYSTPDRSADVLIFPLFLEKNIVAIQEGVYFLDKKIAKKGEQNIKEKDYEKIFKTELERNDFNIIYRSTINQNLLEIYNDNEKAIAAPISFEETKINEKSTWFELLNTFASKVKLYSSDKKDKNETESLSIQFQKLSKPDPNENDFIKKETIASSIIKLIEDKLNESGVSDTLYLNNFLNKIKKVNKDIILIVLGLKQNNFSIKNKPLQKYTIFPNVKPAIKPNTQFFNSGSKNLLDGSFPDVISFQPNLDFSSAIASSIAQKNFLPTMFEKGKFISSGRFNIQIPDSKTAEEAIMYFQDLKSEFEKFIYDSKKEGALDFKKTSNGWWLINEEKDIGFSCATLEKTTKDFIMSFKKNDQNSEDELKNIGILKNIIADYDYEVSEQNTKKFANAARNAFVKIASVFPGDRTSDSYASFLTKSDDFFRILKQSAYNFEADLKILGEPAFSYLWGSQPYLFIEVNNPDGSQNILLSGVYMVMSFTHDIEGGKFTTTLKLKYDSPYLESFNSNNNKNNNKSVQ